MEPAVHCLRATHSLSLFRILSCHCAPGLFKCFRERFPFEPVFHAWGLTYLTSGEGHSKNHHGRSWILWRMRQTERSMTPVPHILGISHVGVHVLMGNHIPILGLLRILMDFGPACLVVRTQRKCREVILGGTRTPMNMSHLDRAKPDVCLVRPQSSGSEVRVLFMEGSWNSCFRIWISLPHPPSLALGHSF